MWDGDVSWEIDCKVKNNMNNLPVKFALSIKPKEYFKQGRGYCGMYSIKGILSAYGKDDKKDIKDYSLSWFGKYTGLTFPWTFSKILNRYNLKAKIGFLKNNPSKIFQIKELLIQNNAPLTLLVGNGYLLNGGYSSRKARTVFHWITLWGYDDNENAFYVYDSTVPKNFYDNNIPIGNKRRTYSEIIRDVTSTFILNNLYIAIT